MACLYAFSKENRDMLKFQAFLIFSLLITMALPAFAAEAPRFSSPVDCKPGEDCWVLNYVDMDPAEGAAKDLQCHARTYDGHKGTDIAIRSILEMNKGVNVIAPLSGKVVRVRDGEEDRFPTPEDLESVKDAQKECGNAILIDHDNGLQTLYCHLKKGSITVKPGQEVKTGDPVAQIGLSGYAQFPHLHFGVLWEGAVIDPFTGFSNMKGCGQVKQPLWEEGAGYVYEGAALYDAGFADIAPDLDAIDRGTQGAPQDWTAATPAVVFWTSILGIREGDRIVMSITSPDGSDFSRREIVQPSTRARQFYYVGKKTEEGALPPGTYTGKTTLTRTDSGGTEKTYDISRMITVR
jgi:biotin carboxyl carrier protein